MISVTISGRVPRVVSKDDLTRALHRTFRSARRRPIGTVALAFVSDAAMRKLNRRWRCKDRSTDVLSFAPAELVAPRGAPKQWGDLIVSPGFVRRSAVRQRIGFREELLRVTIHGMLHLFGFDHATRADERRMFGQQERILHSILKIHS